MTLSNLSTIQDFQRADELIRICRSAVRRARENNRHRGLANVFWINGRRYFELPSGEITQARPENGDVKRN
jgi:hypothetical protein